MNQTAWTKQAIWTRNVRTGVPDEHPNAEVNGSVAVYRDGDFQITNWNGFFLSKDEAVRDTRKACRSLLDFYTKNSKAMRSALKAKAQEVAKEVTP
jgi:hypothetical protein